MASSEAEARRQRFLANKEKFEGNYYAMQKAEYEKDHTVYFLEDGTITCITKEEIEPKKEWKSYIFTREQITILDGKNLDQYRVATNPDDENTYHIELKPIESLYVRNEDAFVQLIEYSKTRSYNIKVGSTDVRMNKSPSNTVLSPIFWTFWRNVEKNLELGYFHYSGETPL